MHLLVRQTSSLDETAVAVDLGHTPAPIVVLSFADSDLSALAAAWAGGPGLRLANLAQLRHPLSVDLYVDSVIRHARCVVVRVLGGADYWRYGLEEVAAVCRAHGIALAVLAGDDAGDSLAGFATVTPAMSVRLDALLRQGGVENARRALALAAHLGGLTGDAVGTADALPACGEYAAAERPGGAMCVIVFYRAHLLAGDVAPVQALADALANRGLSVRALHVASLKPADCAGFVADRLRAWQPAVVLNLTGFSARAADASPLEAAGSVVLQAVLAGSTEAAWRADPRGLSASDLAMQVVLPEADGRLLTTAISFKAERPMLPGLQFAARYHAPHAPGLALAADRAAGWARLAATPRSQRRLAVVLSNYGGGQEGYAVGLDSFASLDAMIEILRDAGYAVAGGLHWTGQSLPLSRYQTLFSTLPLNFQDAVTAAWGPPAASPQFRAALAENLIVAIQPERGHRHDRRAGYHDPEMPPGHDYVGFHLWLREAGTDALIQLGTHGTLEWLPGKAVALGEACAPSVLLGGLPVIYPFIVSNPGEAAVARRRLGAVALGHLTPPLVAAGLSGEAADLELMIDEYAAAQGLDPRRPMLLRAAILDRAAAAGLLSESRAEGLPDDEALSRLDAYLCDVKALSIRDGLHIFARPPHHPRALLDTVRAGCPAADPAHILRAVAACADAERDGLLAALDGRFVQPGPAGAPSRGRLDVLPTGRNLATTDARGIPTPTALRLAEATAADILRRHQQEQGDWPRSLVLDLWGSTTLRTGGEDFAVALVLLGARPVWDRGSGRVNGFEILPLALLDRPRIDVTLRISGLFRDAFADQVALFNQVVQALAARDEAADWNALTAAERPIRRIFGPAPGCFGAGSEHTPTRADLAASYLAASAYSYAGQADVVEDHDGFAARAAQAAAFVHLQDHRETDLLDSPEYAAHEAGFAALGQAAALYHTDITDAGAPRTRLLAEEVVRVVRGRAANPTWLAGMRRHGRSGAAEIARPVEALYRFALGMEVRFDRSFDLLYEATVDDAEVDAFLQAENPEARAAMQARFAQAQARGLWHPRRNAP
jgi:cobaltochelatase CobN